MVTTFITLNTKRERMREKKIFFLSQFTIISSLRESVAKCTSGGCVLRKKFKKL